MSQTLGRGYEALRRGRWSSAGADYFLTLCTHDRMVGLTSDALAAQILLEADKLTTEGLWHLRCAIVMPDHVHLVVTLGAGLELSTGIRMFKGRLAPALRQAGLHWQRGTFDHRLRPDEDRLPSFMYIFMNPYRAGLTSLHERWPTYRCAAEDWTWFEPLSRSECPFPEWLA